MKIPLKSFKPLSPNKSMIDSIHLFIIIIHTKNLTAKVFSKSHNSEKKEKSKNSQYRVHRH